MEQEIFGEKSRPRLLSQFCRTGQSQHNPGVNAISMFFWKIPGMTAPPMLSFFNLDSTFPSSVERVNPDVSVKRKGKREG